MANRGTRLKKKAFVREQLARITRKDKVTIPDEIRHELDLNEGDAVTWTVEKRQVSLKRSSEVVACTNGAFSGGGKALTAEEERAAVEKAIALEVTNRGGS